MSELRTVRFIMRVRGNDSFSFSGVLHPTRDAALDDCEMLRRMADTYAWELAGYNGMAVNWTEVPW